MKAMTRTSTGSSTTSILGLLITTGLIGLLAYLGIFAAMMSAAHRTIRGPDPKRASLALAAFAAVGVIALASGLFDVLSFPHVPYLLFFVGGDDRSSCASVRRTHQPARRAGSRRGPLPRGDATVDVLDSAGAWDRSREQPDGTPEPLAPPHPEPMPVG